MCPSVSFSSRPSAPLSEPTSTLGAGSSSGPCPGLGYTCDDCLDGWFCPPSQTPALSAPCGTGWPCYHCNNGWFCVPSPQTVGASVAQASSTPSAILNAYAATSSHNYIGCYQDTSDKVLKGAQLVHLARGMTNDQCIDFCQSQSFVIAGTKRGSQCFCGNTLLDSLAMDDGQCDMTCSGDTTDSAMCGGFWALSIWSANGSIQQGQGPEQALMLAKTAGSQGISGIRYTKMPVTSAIDAWPPTALSADELTTSLPTSDVSELEIASLSVMASGIHGYQGIATNNVVGSISTVSNVGMSSVAVNVSMANLTSSVAFITGPSSRPLVSGPIIPLTAVPAAATLLVTAMTVSIPNTNIAEAKIINGNAVASEENAPGHSDQVSSSTDAAEGDIIKIAPTLSAIKRERRAFRRRAHSF